MDDIEEGAVGIGISNIFLNIVDIDINEERGRL